MNSLCYFQLFLKVMTVNPDFATLDTTILDALHIMHDGKFLHIPVLDRGRALFMSLRPKRTITKHLLGLYYLMLVLHFPQQKDKLLLAWMSCNLPTQPFNWWSLIPNSLISDSSSTLQ